MSKKNVMKAIKRRNYLFEKISKDSNTFNKGSLSGVPFYIEGKAAVSSDSSKIVDWFPT